MAELSYDDVRRAAQDAVRDVRSSVSSLQHAHNDLRSVQQSSQYQLNDILSKLQTVQQQINLLSSTVKNTNTQPAPIHYNIQQSVADLHRRIARMEQFMEVCYRYFDALNREEGEAGNYKSA